jgi:hypothetical protein
LTLVALVAAASCSKPAEPIHVSANQLTVDNRTRSDWSDVEVWVNDHYRVTLPRLLAGQRFVVPLDTFVAGFGQRFNYRKQVVQGVEVTAKSADGQAVKLVWGRGRRR